MSDLNNRPNHQDANLIQQPKTHQEELEMLQALNFPINPYNSTAGSLEEIWQKVESLEQKRDSLQFPIDGLVVKLNDNQITETLGVVGKTPRTWSAIKFAAEEATTRIKDILWSVGRTGKVTPVADLEPTPLAGTTVKRASLHNFSMVISLQLHELDTVIIRKAGDIIPEVIRILPNLRPNQAPTLPPPKNCPACDTTLEQSETGIDLICPNQAGCKPQIVKRLAYFCQRQIGNITGLSEKQIEKFVDVFGVRDIPDLYELPFETIAQMEGFGEKSAQNLRESLQKSRKIPDYKFLAGLGIEGIGPEVAKLIVREIDK